MPKFKVVVSRVEQQSAELEVEADDVAAARRTYADDGVDSDRFDTVNAMEFVESVTPLDVMDALRSSMLDAENHDGGLAEGHVPPLNAQDWQRFNEMRALLNEWLAFNNTLDEAGITPISRRLYNRTVGLLDQTSC